jgi:TPR repeat protein
MAMYELGCMHWYQRGCMLDTEEAEMWFARAAKLGCARSQYMLGQAYHYGTVSHPKHYETAASHYRMAAQQV